MAERKHAELIRAWADGAEVQYLDADGVWVDTAYPQFREEIPYRVKPKPNMAFAVCLEYQSMLGTVRIGNGEPPNVRLTLDGNTLKVIGVSMVPYEEDVCPF